MVKVKQLCRDLGIKHPDKHSTCIGYGKAKPTCGNAVAAASRSTAASILEGICYAIEDGVSVGDLKSDLNTAACLLHCKRWHQGQGPAMSKDWERKLRYSSVQSREEEHQQSQRRRQRQTSSQTVERGSRRQASSRPTSRSADPPRNLSQYEHNLLEIQIQTSQVLSSMQSILDQYQRSGQRLRLLPPVLTLDHASSRSRVYTDDSDDGGSNSDSEATDWEDSTTPSRASSASTVSRSSAALSRPSSNAVERSQRRRSSVRSSHSSHHSSHRSSTASSSRSHVFSDVDGDDVDNSDSEAYDSEDSTSRRALSARLAARDTLPSSNLVIRSQRREGSSRSAQSSRSSHSSRASRSSSHRATESTSSPSPLPRSSSPSSSSTISTSSGDVNECGICLEPLPRVHGSRSRRRSNNNNTWTCGACHNSAHAECFDTWVANSSEDNVRCIYWYVFQHSYLPSLLSTVIVGALSLLLFLAVVERSGLSFYGVIFISFICWDSLASHSYGLTGAWFVWLSRERACGLWSPGFIHALLKEFLLLRASRNSFTSWLSMAVEKSGDLGASGRGSG